MKTPPHQQIQAEFLKELNKELVEFEDFLSKYREPQPVLVQVAEKICEWRADETKKMWVYAMFSNHRRSPLNFHFGFLGCLSSFLINACLDDSGFTIKWEESRVNESGNVVSVETSRDSEFAMPVVVENVDGNSNPALILEALEEREKRELARMERIHNQQVMIDKFMGRLRQ